MRSPLAALTLAAVLLTPALRARAGSASSAVSSGTLRLALIEDSPTEIDVSLGLALKRLVAESTGTHGAQLLSAQTLPCYYSDDEFRFRAPQLEVSPGTAPAAALWDPREVGFISPPIPSLVEGLRSLAADPKTFSNHWSIALTTRSVTVAQAMDLEGAALITAGLTPHSDEPAIWHNTVVAVYRFRWEGQDVYAAFAGRVFGGIGRLAAAAARERAAGPLIGVARGGVFGTLDSELPPQQLARALEKSGLRYSAVGSTEIRLYKELERYRVDHSSGIQFLSANVVYSSSTDTTFFPSRALARVGGLTVAFTGLTPLSAAKFLPSAGLGQLTVQDGADALASRLTELREGADVLVVLADASGELSPRRLRLPGVDLIVAEDGDGASLARAEVRGRPEYAQPVWTMHAQRAGLSVLEARVVDSGWQADWDLTERHILLNDQIAPAPGFSEYDPSSYGILFSTAPPLLPSARAIFASQDPSAGLGRRLTDEEFWPMAASLLAARTRSEAGLLRVLPLPAVVDGPVPESVVRKWLSTDDPLVFARVPGSQLKALLAQSEDQRRRLSEGLPLDQSRFVAGGVDAGKIHGAPIDDQAVYRVATSRVLADALGLSDWQPDPKGRTIDQVVLAELEARRGSAPASYEPWTQGKPAAAEPLWKINFRDVGVNVQDTHVDRDPAFDAVPNSRIQGFDQLLLGGDVRVDADYFDAPFRWSNTLEMEYAKARLHPRDEPPVTNTTANRITLLTTGTRRVGTVSQTQKWLGSSWGPSMGFEYDGQFEADPGLPRKTIFSAYPGVQFYEGTIVKSMELSANVKRDQSRTPANTQYGLHTRWLAEKDFSGPPGQQPSLAGEFYTNYFFLTRSDQQQDLRWEGDLNVRLNMPVRKYLTVAPFVDFYYFALKTQPLWGYSAMTGISVSFARLWKPQYEKF